MLAYFVIWRREHFLQLRKTLVLIWMAIHRMTQKMNQRTRVHSIVHMALTRHASEVQYEGNAGFYSKNNRTYSNTNARTHTHTDTHTETCVPKVLRFGVNTSQIGLVKWEAKSKAEQEGRSVVCGSDVWNSSKSKSKQNWEFFDSAANGVASDTLAIDDDKAEIVTKRNVTK